ncbi:MAG: hypothetical protein IMY71_11855 [Bacteroidetes bacterium]|nr:hypothetical protein [Bacteroidota bacterium]
MGKREEYIDKLADQLKKWDAEISKLEEKAENAKTDVKAKYTKKADELRAKKESIQQKARDFRDTNEETFNSIKDGIEDSLTRLTNAINDTFKKFSEEDIKEKTPK